MRTSPSPAPTPASPGLVFLCALLPLGFAYVALVLCGRATPFASRVDRWGDFLGVTLSGPAVFLLAARHVLSGRWPSWTGYALAFFTALHWEWIGWLTGASFSLTARDLARLTRADAIMLAVGVACGVGLLFLCGREARRAGELARWSAALLLLPAAIAAITWLHGPGWRLHVHHYFWALCLAPFVRYRHPVCLLAQGFLVGVYVEGASRWGMGAIWNQP